MLYMRVSSVALFSSNSIPKMISMTGSNLLTEKRFLRTPFVYEIKSIAIELKFILPLFASLTAFLTKSI